MALTVPDSASVHLASRQKMLAGFAIYTCAGLAGALGFLVSIGWLLQSDDLVRLGSGLTPMRFNTALAMLACGLGLAAVRSGFARFATGVGAAAGLLALLTLAEYTTGTRLGIAQLSVESAIFPDSVGAGRMAPYSAVCLLLVALWLVVNGAGHARLAAASVSLVVAPAIVGIALISAIGHLSGVDALFGWSESTRMAVHTTAGFLLLGAGASVQTWRSERRRSVPRSYAYIAPAVVASLTLMLGVWLTLAQAERDRLSERMSSDISVLGTAIEQLLLAELRSLDRIAHRWSLSGGRPADQWRPDFRRQVEDAVALTSIAVLGPDGEQRGRVSPGRDIAVPAEVRRDGLQAASAAGTTWLSPVLRLDTGEVVVAAYTPLRTAGGPDGVLESVLRIDRAVAEAGRPDLDRGYALGVGYGGERLIRLAGNAGEVAAGLTVSDTLQVRNRTLSFEMSLSARQLRQARSFIAEIVLAVGLLVTLLVGLVVHFLHASRETEWLRRTNAELEAVNRELDQFAYAASHDLKAPLRSVRQLLNWIRADLQGRFDEQTDRYLRQMDSRIDRLQTLLDAVLVYARIGRQAAVGDRFEAAPAVAEAVALAGPPAGMSVTIDVAAGLVLSDRALFDLVVVNLVGNAIKHHDRAEGEVRVTGRHEGSIARFSVSDDGPGIPPRFHARVFEMFQTLKPRDELEASGMGLALVRKSVERVGGRVWIESDPQAGRGSTIIFDWPMEKNHGR